MAEYDDDDDPFSCSRIKCRQTGKQTESVKLLGEILQISVANAPKKINILVILLPL
jgi:hypothetical protein